MSIGEKADIVVCSVLQPSCANVATQVSDYVKMDGFDRCIFVVEAGSGLGNTGVILATMYSAYSATGGGAADISVYSTIGTTEVGTSKTGCNALLIDNASSWLSMETVAINGITYTFNSSAGVTTGTFTTDRYVVTLNDGSVPTKATEHLSAYINHATYGVPGVIAVPGGDLVATASSNNVYISAYGQNTVSAVVSASSHEVIVPCRVTGRLEVSNQQLLANTSHKYVAVSLACSSAVRLGVTAIRYGTRYKFTSTDTVIDVGEAT